MLGGVDGLVCCVCWHSVEDEHSSTGKIEWIDLIHSLGVLSNLKVQSI